MTNFSPTPNMIAEKKGPVGRLVFNKPQKHNATSTDMWEAIPIILDEFEKDPAIRVVVVTGAGDKAFVSGADISEFEKARNTPEQVAYYDKIGEIANTRLSKCSKPTIARIRGYCIGGGLAVSLLCDIRIASENSKFGVPAARLGLGYEYAGLATLARLVGPSAAKDILFSARQLEADEALRLGLVNFVCSADALGERVSDYAEAIAGNAPLTIKAAKAAMRLFERYSDVADERPIDELVNRCFDSDDYREGRRAFMDKRAPRFSGS